MKRALRLRDLSEDGISRNPSDYPDACPICVKNGYGDRDDAEATHGKRCEMHQSRTCDPIPGHKDGDLGEHIRARLAEKGHRLP